jgi:hypothetical protein
VIGAMRQKVSGAKFVNLSQEEGDLCNVSSSFKGKFGLFQENWAVGTFSSVCWTSDTSKSHIVAVNRH